MDLKGKTVVVTGTWSRPRSAVEADIAGLGAKVTGSVSKHTDVLFAGTDAGSKLNKAQALGIPILAEKDLDALLAAAKGGATKATSAAPARATPKPAKVGKATPAPTAAAPTTEKTIPAMAGKLVVVTGTFVKLARKDVERILTSSGATVSVSVLKKTDLLIVGADAGSKLGAATAFGIQILNEDGFMELLGEKLEVVTFDGPLGDWLVRFKAFCDGLMKHKDVRVLNFSIGSPVSDAEIDRVEESIGAPLTPAIKNLYRQANGLSLRWISKSHIEAIGREDDDEEFKFQPKLREYPSDNGTETGCICLLPLRKVFLQSDQDWFGIFVFDKNDKAGQHIRVFDYYNFFHMAALQTSVNPGNPAVIIGDDHGACFDEPSPALTFEKYMERVLANGFIASERFSTKKRTLDQLIKVVVDNAN